MRSADIDERMRCAVDGCSPVYCAICFSPSGSGCCDRTSSSFIMRSITWIGFFASSRGVAAIPHCKMRRHACGREFMATVTCIEDLRELARKRVARAIFEYVDCGSYTECTLRANKADIDADALAQRDRLDVGLVHAQRALGIRAAVDILEDRARNALSGQLAEILDAGHRRHKFSAAGMAAHFTMWNGRDSSRRGEKSDPGDRAHDEAARCPVEASRAARTEADRAVNWATSVTGETHPHVTVCGSTSRTL